MEEKGAKVREEGPEEQETLDNVCHENYEVRYPGQEGQLCQTQLFLVQDRMCQDHQQWKKQFTVDKPTILSLYNTSAPHRIFVHDNHFICQMAARAS